MADSKGHGQGHFEFREILKTETDRDSTIFYKMILISIVD